MPGSTGWPPTPCWRWTAAEAVSRGWEVWIDRGGTFTDVVARRPDGTLSTQKLLSEGPRPLPRRRRRGRSAACWESDPGAVLDAVKMGTTVATNALLERRGEPTLLAITAGLGDQLRIGYQNRPKIFAREIVRPEPLYATVTEIDARVPRRRPGAAGRWISPPPAPACRRPTTRGCAPSPSC